MNALPALVTAETADDYYRRDPGVANYSALKILVRQSPAHYWHYQTSPNPPETPAQAFGKAAHVALLEPERFAEVYRVLPADAPRDLRYLRDAAKPSDATKASIAWWDEWEADSTRQTLTLADYDLAQAMGRSLRALPIQLGRHRIKAGDLFDVCQREVTLRWIDEDTGLPCKARLDLYSPEHGFVGDPKFCRDASPEAFGRDVMQFAYHLQCAHYCDGLRVLGTPARHFVYFPVEKEPPHVAASWIVDAPSYERGWTLRQRAMATLQRCLTENHWPGYTQGFEEVSIPAFGHYNTNEDRQA